MKSLIFYAHNLYSQSTFVLSSSNLFQLCCLMALRFAAFTRHLLRQQQFSSSSQFCRLDAALSFSAPPFVLSLFSSSIIALICCNRDVTFSVIASCALFLTAILVTVIIGTIMSSAALKLFRHPSVEFLEHLVKFLRPLLLVSIYTAAYSRHWTRGGLDFSSIPCPSGSSPRTF
jgi:hypothetical protein